jgi:Ni,Fe-hydrogenase III large subunit
MKGVGTSSFHSAAYCMAVERMADIVITVCQGRKNTFLELERLYNHIGDIGNMCAGSGLAVGYAKGRDQRGLMQLNETLTEADICEDKYHRG